MKLVLYTVERAGRNEDEGMIVVEHLEPLMTVAMEKVQSRSEAEGVPYWTTRIEVEAERVPPDYPGEVIE